MSLCLYVSMSVCFYVRMSVCLYVCMSVCMYVKLLSIQDELVLRLSTQQMITFKVFSPLRLMNYYNDTLISLKVKMSMYRVNKKKPARFLLTNKNYNNSINLRAIGLKETTGECCQWQKLDDCQPYVWLDWCHFL